MNIYDLEHFAGCDNSQNTLGGFWNIPLNKVLSFRINDGAFSAYFGNTNLISTKLVDIPPQGISLQIPSIPSVVTTRVSDTTGGAIKQGYSVVGGWKEGNASFAFSSSSSLHSS
jgi:hypothetical protein